MIDNYDSFTYNLVQYMGELGADIRVERNDNISIDEIESFFLNKNFRNVFIEGGNSVIDLFLKHNKIDTIYEFRSQKNIDSGLKISQAYLDNVKNDFSISNEYQLLDNSLTTYTKD